MRPRRPSGGSHEVETPPSQKYLSTKPSSSEFSVIFGPAHYSQSYQSRPATFDWPATCPGSATSGTKRPMSLSARGFPPYSLDSQASMARAPIDDGPRTASPGFNQVAHPTRNVGVLASRSSTRQKMHGWDSLVRTEQITLMPNAVLATTSQHPASSSTTLDAPQTTSTDGRWKLLRTTPRTAKRPTLPRAALCPDPHSRRLPVDHTASRPVGSRGARTDQQIPGCGPLRITGERRTENQPRFEED